MPINVFVSPTPDENGKFQGIVRAFPAVWHGSVLDVGCRSGNLRKAISHNNLSYCGVDISPPADVVASLDKGLPFADAAHDVAVALDVLEHTNDIHYAFDELCRVARRHVIISLPNMYQLQNRVKFLLGRRLSGKYSLLHEPQMDRHRWVFSFQEARDFTRVRARQNGYRILTEGCLVGPRRGSAVLRALTARAPNLLSPWYIAALQRQES